MCGWHKNRDAKFATRTDSRDHCLPPRAQPNPGPTGLAHAICSR